MKKEIKLFEAFAGIGSQYKALKNIENKMNWIVKPVGMIEWYIDAIVAYIAIHYPNIKLEASDDLNLENISISRDSKKPISKDSLNKIKNSKSYIYIYISNKILNNKFDITKTKSIDLPNDIDIFTYSFPCQDLSVQGKQRGMNKNSNTRSGLLWEVERILKEIYSFNKNNLPKYLVLENVKNMISAKHNIAYQEWLKELENLGYESKTYKLNSINFNSPQSRERVFCISVRKDIKNKNNYIFPDLENIKVKNKKILKDILENEYDKKLELNHLLKYKLTNPVISPSNIKKSTLEGYTNFHSESYVYYSDYSGPTLTASGANSRIKILDNRNKIRMMSAKECYRYMGFNDQDYFNVAKTRLLSETKIIYTAGNSIVVSVLEEIFKSFKF